MSSRLLKLLQQQRFSEAQELCADLCNSQPRNAELQFMMSAISGQLGDFENSEKYSRSAIKINPHVPEAYFNLGVAQRRLGKERESMQSIRQALRLRPAFPEALNELACIHQQAGRLDAAVAEYGKALELHPQYPDALHNLGCVLLQQADIGGAQAKFEAALAASPLMVEPRIQLSKIKAGSGELSAAIEDLRKVVRVNPLHAEANLALAELEFDVDAGSSLKHCRQAAGDAPESKLFYARLAAVFEQHGLLDESIEYYRKSLALDPDDAVLLTNLGVVLKESGRPDESIEALEKSLAIDSGNAEAHYNLAIACSALHRHGDAEAGYRKCIELNPGLVEAHANLGSLLMLQGRIAEAQESLQSALDISPHYALAASNRLFSMNYLSDFSSMQVFEAHRDWGNEFSRSIETVDFREPTVMACTTTRIGLVSADFCDHSVAYFLDALTDIDADRFEIHCYSNTRRVDDTTGRVKDRVAGWHDITRMADHEAARLVHDNNIDILIDLSGHTSGNRLGIFVLRPAKILITYLGYPNTTGLSSMDYRITDCIADPDGNDRYYTEKLLRLDRCFLCYTPPVETVMPVPNKDGPVVFGSFNNLAKVSPGIIRLWSELLKRVPDSQLVIKNWPLADASVADRLRAEFAAQGIASERLQLIPWVKGMAGHLDIYNHIDIALDTYPYNGTTTTCEAVWMGRPVVTLQGEMHASRVGASLLHSLCMDELIASSEEEYIDIAVDLASRLDSPDYACDRLRDRLLQSSLCDRNDYLEKFTALLDGVLQKST